MGSRSLKKRSKLQAKLAEFLKKTPEEQMLICRRAGPPEGYCECCQVKYSDINAVRMRARILPRHVRRALTCEGACGWFGRAAAHELGAAPRIRDRRVQLQGSR